MRTSIIKIFQAHKADIISGIYLILNVYISISLSSTCGSSFSFLSRFNFILLQRQLNLYGFRRITKGSDTGAYSHPLFSRDNASHVDTIKRVVRKGANGGGNTSNGTKWNPNNRSRQTGASPNSSHSFPDVHENIPPPFKNMSRQMSSSWPTPSSNVNNEDDDEEYEDEEYPGAQRIPDNGNAYSKPYYTQSSRSRNRGENDLNVNVESRHSHRYGTRGADQEDGDEMEDWDGYPHSAPSPSGSGFGGGDKSMDMDSRSMPMPSNQFGYNDKSINRNQVSLHFLKGFNNCY